MQTLTDKEYQRLRDASVAIIREMGVECGGSNVQMAVNPADGEVSPLLAIMWNMCPLRVLIESMSCHGESADKGRACAAHAS